ncbi:MAG: rhomboid family intramembrane serine protease [Bosea sp. (in: a-proteobacteria)]
MFLPLHDGVPVRHVKAQFVTVGMIVLCALIFASSFFGLWRADLNVVAAGFGMIPSVLFGTASLPQELSAAPAFFTPLTNIFLHASVLHLVGNMLFLWVFGDNVEDAMGHVRFALFLLMCGVAGSLGHAWMNPASESPLIGASGAVSGVIAAYLVLHPHVRVLGLVLKAIPVRIPALWVLGAWIALQVFQAFAGLDASVGWWAHIAGFVAGLVLTPLFVRPGTKLLGRDISVVE